MLYFRGCRWGFFFGGVGGGDTASLYTLPSYALFVSRANAYIYIYIWEREREREREQRAIFRSAGDNGRWIAARVRTRFTGYSREADFKRKLEVDGGFRFFRLLEKRCDRFFHTHARNRGCFGSRNYRCNSPVERIIYYTHTHTHTKRSCRVEIVYESCSKALDRI